jgi:hypothetical protein
MKVDTDKFFEELKRFCSWGGDSRRDLTKWDALFTVISFAILFTVALILSKIFGW